MEILVQDTIYSRFKQKYARKNSPERSGLFSNLPYEYTKLFCDGFRSLLTSVELINGARFEDSFFSRVKRMALVTGFHFDFRSNRTTGDKGVSTGTSDFRLCRKLWVNIFHRNKKMSKMSTWAVLYG